MPYYSVMGSITYSCEWTVQADSVEAAVGSIWFDGSDPEEVSDPEVITWRIEGVEEIDPDELLPGQEG